MALLTTAQVLESNEGRGISVAAGKGTATRSFLFIDFRDESEGVLDGFGQSLFQNPDASTIETPKNGDPHPLFGNLSATNYSLKKVPGSINHWEATWTYESGRSGGESPNSQFSQGPEAIGFTDFACRTIAKPMLVYRVNASLVNTEGDAIDDDDNIFDIGGKPVDAATKPITIFRKQVEISRSETMPFQNLKNINEYAEVTGRRGSVDAFESGSVLYLGADIQRIGIETFRVQHKYLYDHF